MNLNSVNVQFKAAVPNRSVVKYVSDGKDMVDGKIVAALVEKLPAIKVLAGSSSVSEVKIAQHGDCFMINTGAVTSYIDKSKIRDAESLYRAVEDNIYVNQNPATALREQLNIRL